MKNIFLSFLFLTFYFSVAAQTSYAIASEDGVKISVKGSSTLHEWEAVASEITDYPKDLSTDLPTAAGFESFGFKVGVESLDGGRGASMNKKIRTALLSAEHPHIIYQATSVTIETADEGYVLKTSGIVTIAGKEKEIEVNAAIKTSDDGLVISGNKALKMGDFGIEPPSAMFGQIKTRDDITVHFEFRYAAK